VDSTLPWNLEGYPSEAPKWQRWREERLSLWQELSGTLPRSALAAVHAGCIGLEEVPDAAHRILKGEVAGRLVVNVGEAVS